MNELERLNAIAPDDAIAELLACNAARRWATGLVAGRPYATAEDLSRASDEILATLDWDDVRQALDAHPRIGERTAGISRDAAWSRREQAGAAEADPAVAAALLDGNRAYEDRFGHVFLICATGLSAEAMLTDLHRRLGHDPASEREVVRDELTKITRLRLAKLLTGEAEGRTGEADRGGSAVGVRLGANSYGKAEVRVVRVARTGTRHELTDLNVSVALTGDLAATHYTGDNTDVLPTDTQKNTVYAFAKEYGIGEVEEFGLRLARHFVQAHPAIRSARVHLEQYAWDRIDSASEHSFVRAGTETRTATVSYDGAHAWIVSGLTGLTVLNSTASEFRGYRRDAYTTLPETDERILATDVTARWRHVNAEADFAKSYREARRHLLEAFADTYSRSLQQTLYAMGSRILANQPELCEVRLSLPNKHHLLVDLSPFGLENRNEVFFAADRPYGLIEGAVVRERAPSPGLAWG